MGLDVVAESVIASECMVAFPLDRRVGEIRRAARTLATVTCVDLADAYRHDVAERFFAELAAVGLPEERQDEMVGAFFAAVDAMIEDEADDFVDVSIG